MTNQQLWQAVLGELELSLTKGSFSTWFKKTFIIDGEGDGITVGVPNTFSKTWLEQKFYRDIIKVVDRLTEGKIKKVAFKVTTQKPAEQSLFTATPPTPAASQSTEAAPAAPAQTTAPAATPAARPAAPTSKEGNRFGLNPRYTFDSFVVGKNNELAHAAAIAVAKTPGRTYNPLFIYGGVGLGKTHLMQAIGHRMVEMNPEKRVIYSNSEKFTNEFIKAIQSGTIDDFKRYYRSPDLLLIDDIQFLAGKESTQEEFFHTFNALHQENKQIVMTSDRPPKAIPALEERLISRFEWGLITDIGTPDYEMRLAILEAKCREKKCDLSADVLNYIANNVASNIRELEGALNKIIALMDVNKMVPNIDNVKKVLVSWTTTNDKSRSITAKDILTTVCDFYDLTLSDLVGSCREKRLVVPRQIAMYIMRNDLKMSFPGIGQEMGGRDHTTAMHACTKIGKEVEQDEKIRQDITLLKERLYNK